jgi:hypothetical protein
MRLVIWLAVPIGLVAAAVGLTVILEMAHGGGYCGTWMAFMMPDCR